MRIALYHFLIVITMKILIKFLNIMGKEAGTLPGRISLIICKNIRDYLKFEGKIIVITGTNGKTTTNNLFYEILKREGKKVINKYDGFFIENVLCTNLNGPLFSKNPELAEWIIKFLLDRKYKCNIKLKNIDDKLEIIAKNNIINNIKKVNV